MRESKDEHIELVKIIEESLKSEVNSNSFGGRNGEVIEIYIEQLQMSVAIKRYKSKNYRIRLEREWKFLKHGNSLKAKEMPKGYCCNRTKGWIAMEWLIGKKPKTLSKEVQNDFVKLIHIINTRKHTGETDMELAQDAWEGIDSIIGDIKKRINNIKKDVNKSSKIIDCVKNTIEPRLIEEESILNRKRHNLCWANKNKSLIISPSDVGIHNIIKTARGHVFYDFEYSGYDDLAKMVSDWIYQPNHIGAECVESIIKDFNKTLIYQQDDAWIERLEDTRMLNKIKWLLIIAKNTYQGEEVWDTNKTFDKYIERHFN